jgi:hypothetical protein
VSFVDSHDGDARRFRDAGEPVQVPVHREGFPPGVGEDRRVEGRDPALRGQNDEGRTLDADTSLAAFRMLSSVGSAGVLTVWRRTPTPVKSSES